MEQARFRAMGTDCHVLVAAPAREKALLALATTRVALLEQSWSRFRPDSELCRLNARAGSTPVAVSADLLLLAERMTEAWHLTGGLFDPTVLASMVALGYDADLATVTARMIPAADDVVVLPAPGMQGVAIDHALRTVRLPAGVGIDPGAIGKGLAADIVVEELLAAGATGVLVNLGGDISIGGSLDERWVIGIEDTAANVPSALVTLPYGSQRAGIATSTTSKRRWAAGRRHHIVDPRTGWMAADDITQATVVSDEAWRAEVLATTALLADDAALADAIHRAGAWCRLVRTDGTVRILGELPTPDPLDHHTHLEARRG